MIKHASPAVGEMAEIYTVPVAREAYFTGWACNTTDNAVNITVYVVARGGVPEAGTELYSGLRVDPHDTFAWSPMHLQSEESVYVAASTEGVVFSITGQELGVGS